MDLDRVVQRYRVQGAVFEVRFAAKLRRLSCYHTRTFNGIAPDAAANNGPIPDGDSLQLVLGNSYRDPFDQ